MASIAGEIIKAFSIVWERAIRTSDRFGPHAWNKAVLFCLALLVSVSGLIHAKSVLDERSRSKLNRAPSVWSLVWSDEFEGPNGSAVDPSKWTLEVGGNGWGNNELETYTSRTANADLEGGTLVIKALKETFTGTDGLTRNYTSARLLTKTKFTQMYGRFEARLKIPYGQGLWPAFWMLGDNIDSAHWPNCGEIDVMENIGREPSIVHGTIHGPGYSGGNGLSSSYSLPSNQRFTDSFHTFAVEWEPNVVRFYCDGILYKTRTPADLPQGQTWVFNHPFFILLNVAVGGNWPGSPDGTTVFPQTMQVDYVRVYQRGTPSASTLLLTDAPANAIYFWVGLFSTVGTILAVISSIILAWISNNRAKAEFILKQAEAAIQAREAELRAREAELRVKELELKLAILERDRSQHPRLIVVKD